MTIKNLLTRRNFLGSADLLAGMLLNARRAFGLSAGGTSGALTPDRLTGFGSTGTVNVYEELGVAPVINGQGTMTFLGGSLKHGSRRFPIPFCLMPAGELSTRALGSVDILALRRTILANLPSDSTDFNQYWQSTSTLSDR